MRYLNEGRRQAKPTAGPSPAEVSGPLGASVAKTAATPNTKRKRTAMAVVSLSEQRITIYDTNGPVLWALVSSGQAEYETAAGLVRQGSVVLHF